MEERAGILVLGGGIVGSSVAWSLVQAGAGDVEVVDLDLAGVYASSELNAGGARATWWQPVNIETCRATLDFFREHAQAFGFRPHGYLWLYDDRALHARALAHRALQNRLGLRVEALDVAEVRERFPLLDRHMDELVGATFSPGDGLVNPNAVRQWFRREAEAAGARFLNRHYVTGVTTERVAGAAGSLRRIAALDVVEVAHHGVLRDADLVREILVAHRVPAEAQRRAVRVRPELVVNCLGAWSPVFSAKAALTDVTEPVRRQLALVDVRPQDLAPGVSFERLGMVVDPSGLYYHPEGPHLLAGFSIPEEVPGFDFEYDGDAFFVEQIWPRLAHRASSFERCGHVRGWAGLYAVTPDRSGIAGAVDGFSNLYEAHSFTGRGVMQSYAIGRALAALITGGASDGIDITPLRRSRFRDPARWVLEELHI